MIQLRNTLEVQTIHIPKGIGYAPGAALELTFRNTVDLNNVAVGTVVDLHDYKDYFVFAVAIGQAGGDFNADFSDDFLTWFPLTNGEYEYTLTADGKTIATGIAIVGDYKARRHSYSKEIQYKQYEG